MTRRLIFTTVILGYTSLLQSFGQLESKDGFESCRGFLITPVLTYKEIRDIDYRRRERTFDRTDSSISFITDNPSEVSASCEGEVISIKHDQDNNYILITKIANYFICYSRLARPVVKVGDKIQAGQRLANLTKGDNEMLYQLDFAIYLADKDLHVRNINVRKWLRL